MLLGGAIVVGSWRMDRLESLGINPFTAPGLVPGVLGAAILLMGLLLALRSWRAAGRRVGDTARKDPAADRRLWIALLLCLAYAGGLVGRGPPFWLATFLFVFLFILAFDLPARRAAGQARRGIALAAIYGAGTALVVTEVFQDLFLVRLP